MDNYLKSFCLRLQDDGFKPDEGKTYWTGRVSIEWNNDENGKGETAEHVITIGLLEGFPYRLPVVFSKDDPPLAQSWHLNPGDQPTLCLWDSETGWKPDYTAHKLLNRISDWFYYYHTNTWPIDSQVPDLHLYLDRIGTVIIGEDWIPSSDISDGQFVLWRSKKFASTPHIASSIAEQSEPEFRLADKIGLGSNPTRYKGKWFRVPEPFVPSNRLDKVLSQIDELMQEPSGWSIEKCKTVVGVKTSGTGFPLAIGYPDHLNETRWLFLWGQFPKRKGERYKWSSLQNMRHVTVHSFQTAPASKEALLRRSAYLSGSLTSKRIAIFGVGALGGSVALLLAKAGVGELRLIDKDYVMPGNAMRHICGLSYVGFRKTTAVQHVIQYHNPDCYIECFEATWAKTRLIDYINSCDLVIDATANTNFSIYLNEICVAQNQPIAFITAYRRARVGRIIMRFEDQAPCFGCYLSHREVWAEDEFPTIPASFDENFIEDGCGSVTEEAAALDVEAVANFGARQLITFLQGTHDGSNLGIIVNSPLPEVDTYPLGSSGFHFWNNKRYTNCLICGA